MSISYTSVLDFQPTVHAVYRPAVRNRVYRVHDSRFSGGKELTACHTEIFPNGDLPFWIKYIKACMQAPYSNSKIAYSIIIENTLGV